MDIDIQKKSPLTIKEQIKGQIRIHIESGDLVQGQMLPSARDLGNILNVNRNTVHSAYKALADEGWVYIVKGSGTYVSAKKVAPHTDLLKRVYDDAMKNARDLGFSASHIRQYFLDRLSTPDSHLRERRILVVDCNDEAIEEMAAAIHAEMTVGIERARIQELESDPQKAYQTLQGIDLVVAGFNHVEEFHRALPACPVEVVGVVLKPDVKLMNELLRLPAGTHVGFSCVNQRSTETVHRSLPVGKRSSLSLMCAGLDHPERVREMAAQCDVIFATEYVYDAVAEMMSPDQRLVKICISIDPANVELIKERLLALSEA